MNILKIIHGYPPQYNAGSEVYSQSICNELAKNHSVTVFTREENVYKADHTIQKQTKDNISFYYVNKAREKDGYQHADLDHQFAQIVAEIKPDIAHIGHLNHLSTGLITVLKKARIPIVFTLHDFWLMCPRGQFLQINFANPTFHQLCDGQNHQKCALNCYNRFFSGQKSDFERDLSFWTHWIETRMGETKQIIEKVDLFLAPSQYLRNRFIQDFEVPPIKIQYLDYGFPLHYLSPMQPKLNDCFTIGYIGTHIPAKGIDLLINAFAQLKGDAILKIWGREQGQSTHYLKQLAASCPNKVDFCGEYVNKNLAKSVFSNIDCIVVPSIWGENSPLVIHEAQTCHIPVITADFGGMSEYVRHLENGLLFQHRNVQDLAQKLQFAFENQDLMQKLGQKGYLYSADGQVPSIEAHCKTLEQIYHNLINQNATQYLAYHD